MKLKKTIRRAIMPKDVFSGDLFSLYLSLCVCVCVSVGEDALPHVQ